MKRNDKDVAPPTLTGKAYAKQLKKLQVELCHLQEWAKATGARIILLFEGRDAAGKGGIIKAITERVSARIFKVVALPAPTEREKTQLFMQRYIAHFPAAGEILVLDRRWYNRAGVGFTSCEVLRQGGASPLSGSVPSCGKVDHRVGDHIDKDMA